MYQIYPVIQELIKVLRGTDMPWVGDEIEAHLRLGKTSLFCRGVDDTKEGLKRRQDSFFIRNLGDFNKLHSSTAMDDDNSKEFSEIEQIEEALRILTCQIEFRVNLEKDLKISLEKGLALSDVNLAIADGKGGKYQFSRLPHEKRQTNFVSASLKFRSG